MANVKITELTALTDPASSDVLPIVDVGADTTKKVTIADLLENAGDGAAATPAFSFDNDKSVGMWRPGSEQLAFSTSGTTRLFINSSGDIGINTSSPAAKAHISNSYSAPTGGHDSNLALIVSNSGSASNFTGIGIAAGNNAGSFIHFGDTDDDNVGALNYFHDTNSLTFVTAANERLRLDSSGNIGIAETSPSSHSAGTGIPTLVLKGNSASYTARSGGLVFVSQDGGSTAKTFMYHDTDFNIQSTTATNIRFHTSNTQQMTLDSSGNLGVGETSPSAKINLKGTNSTTYDATSVGGQGTNASVKLANANTAANTFTGIDFSTNNNRVVNRIISGHGSTTDDGFLAFITEGSGTPAEQLRINSSGVGIGTTSPQTITHVFGADPILRIQDSETSVASSFAAIQLAESGTGGSLNNYWQIALEGDSGTSTDHLTFKDITSERMRIDSSGNVAIGTTSASSILTAGTGSGTNAITINGSGSSTSVNQLIFYGGGTNNPSAAIEYDGADKGIAFQIGNYSALSSSEAMRIDSSGRLLVGTSSARANFFNGTFTSLFQVEGTAGGTNRATMSLTNNSSGNDGAWFTINKSNGTADGSNTLVSDGNTLGSIGFQGSDGSEFVFGATITAEVDGTPGANDMPGRLKFATTADGASTSTTRMTIDSSGRVGIGTALPERNLHVFKGESGGAASNADSSLVLENSSNTYLQFLTPSSSESGILFGDNDNNVGAITYLHSNNSLNFTVNASLAMTVDSSGRLLVGTSSSLNSAYKLQIAGETDAAANVACFRGNATGQALLALTKSRTGTIGNHTIVQDDDNIGAIQFRASDGTNYITGASIETEVDGTPGTDDMPGRLKFATTADGGSSPTERMRIQAGGRILLGTSSTTYASSSWKTTSRVGVVTTTSSNSGDVAIECSAGSTSSRFHISFSNTNGVVGSISTSGSATAFNTSSDYRLKENVVDIADGITRVKQLAPKRFNFIADADTTVDGFLAHEAQTVVPEAVTGTHNEVDDNGDAVMQGIDQSKLVPLLTAALQEAIAKIETLEQRLTDAGL